MADGSGSEIAAEIRERLSNYTVVLVDVKGAASPLGTGEKLGHLIEGARGAGPLGYSNASQPFNHMLVAWHPGPGCKDSPAVYAVESLWGDAASV